MLRSRWHLSASSACLSRPDLLSAISYFWCSSRIVLWPVTGVLNAIDRPRHVSSATKSPITRSNPRLTNHENARLALRPADELVEFCFDERCDTFAVLPECGVEPFFGLVVEFVCSTKDGVCGDLWVIDADHSE